MSVASGGVVMGKAGRYLAYAALLLGVPLIQALVPLVLGHASDESAYYLMLATAGGASLAAFACLRVVTYESRTMACLAVGLASWAVGMGNAIANSDAEQNLISTYVFFMSYGLPLLYAAVATRDEPATPARRAVDGALLVLLVILCYLGVRDLQDDQGFLKAAYAPWVAIAFDVENAFLFLAFLIRLLAAQDEREHRFFRLATWFLGVYAVAAAAHNHDEYYPTAWMLRTVVEVLPAMSFMLLACLLHANQRPRLFVPAQRQWARQLAAGFAPGVLLAAIFALSVGIRETQGTFGRVALALAMLAYVVRVVQTQFWFAATRDRLAEALAVVERVSLLDELTDIPNRRAFEHVLDERMREAVREMTPISALMIDVDRFKRYNDTLGHLEGDIALRAVARLLAGALRRPADFIARFGGEEFVVLLPNTPSDGAEVVARRMNRAVYDAALAHREGIDGRVTVSVGAATAWQGAASDLMREADQALYRAKSAGRNGYASAEPPVPEPPPQPPPTPPVALIRRARLRSGQ